MDCKGERWEWLFEKVVVSKERNVIRRTLEELMEFEELLLIFKQYFQRFSSQIFFSS
jgi:hypothetical protein